MTWSAEKLAQLKVLAGQGLSAKAIGGEMGVSKNSIISACSRRGIKLENIVGWSSTNDKALAAKAPPSKPRVSLAWRPTSEPKPMAPIVHYASDDDIPADQRRTLLELGSGECRFPLGEGDAMMFCAGPSIENSAYCHSHHHRSRIKGSARSF